MQLVKRFIDGGWNGEVGELNQQIIFLVNRVLLWILAHVLQILKAQMEVAAGG